MSRNRLEAFSDGVMAIIITIMVLELVPPHEPTLQALFDLWPTFLSYVLSFVVIGIYWNNHHHLFQAVRFVNGQVLWANLHLLFWLSLLPFATGWMGENAFASLPVAVYGLDLLAAAIAYYLLVRALLRAQPEGSAAPLAEALGRDWKGRLSPVAYAVSVPIAFVAPWVSFGVYVAVALIWVVPDTRIERRVAG
jgi:uncharacterized membrane protein